MAFAGLSWLARRTGAATRMPVQQASGSKPRFARGVDVSLWQGEIDWDAVAASGIDFAIVKVSQYGFKSVDKTTGATTIVPGFAADPRFKANQIGARRTMKRVGYYHWMEPQFGYAPDGDGAAQADACINLIGALQPGEFVAIDLENRSLSADVVVPQMMRFLRRVELLTDRKPYVYTSAGFPYHLGTSGLAEFPLWVVWYVSLDQPRLPPGWPDWKIWQYTDKGKVPGIGGTVDYNAAEHSWVVER